ncbi:hypothetical protein MalM25_03170 [Planctomycetes bacterium MalM25]|nr:hypothetical protein MalM25_03170 [Planctomycetes bacterium MalM25]
MDRWPTQSLALLAAVLLAAAPAAAQTPTNGASPKAAGTMAILIRNPNTRNGEPPYALADQFGRVQRFVEPSPGMKLAPHVGQKVRIRHDTGDILLASQLVFPSPVSSRTPVAEPSSELRAVSPAQFIPPRKVSRIETALATDEPGQQYVVVPVQLVDRLVEGADRYGEASESDPTEPIDLDEILDGEAGDPDLSDDAYADELPSPTGDDRLEPIPATEVLPEYTLNEATGSHHAADCPHCQSQANKPYSRYDNDCPHCNAAPCPTCNAPKGFCGPSCNPASRRGIYGRVEYLLWTFDGMNTPPLVTTNTQGGAPILGVAGTQVVFGGDLLDGSRDGLRFTIGGWLDNNRDIGLEASWTNFETESDVYGFSDLAGTSVLGRPFYNTSPIDPNDNELPPADDVQLISFPNAVGGSLSIAARSRFRMAGLLLRTGLCCREIGGGCDPCNCPSCQGGGGLLGLRKGARPRAISRVDFLVGYRHADLEEELIFNENVTLIGTSTPSAGGTVSVNEGFEVDNDFHGIDLGVSYEWLSRRWGLELLSKVALGNTRQRVSIYGTNTIGANGVQGVTTPGGLLAQTSNLGVYERDQFSILPELSARLSYRVTERFSLSAGYTLVYWANVVRPGDHIDFSVNGGLASNPLYNTTAYTHPRFDWDETSFWAHGLNLGAELNY